MAVATRFSLPHMGGREKGSHGKDDRQRERRHRFPQGAAPGHQGDVHPCAPPGGGDERQRAFVALRRLRAVHETAEEEIVHPAARRVLPDGPVVVDARLQEENQAKKALAELEAIGVDSTDFLPRFRALQADVLAHAKAEERDEFERLAGELEPESLEHMRNAVKFAESVAPTRPHPGVESSTANMLAGPFASMVDRVRDALGAKR
jgi:hypothetical protein